MLRFALSCVLAMVFVGAAAAVEPGPNVLLLICDDMNCDLGCYGHALVRSPNIDDLAGRGVRFERAYCQFALCGPSRASFMTGLYPDQTLVRRNSIYIRERTPNVQTMPQMFRDAGYFATRIGKVFHYNVPGHIGTGGHDDPYSWDQTINPRGRDKDDEDKIFSLVPKQFGATLSWLAAEGTDEEQTDGIAATEAVRLLERYAEEKKPFFLAVGLFRPHTPYVAPKKYFDMYPLEEIRVPRVPEDYLDTLPWQARLSLTAIQDQIGLVEDLARQAIRAYYASISFADAQVGRVLDALEETGLADNTVVVLTSDHGYHMGEHGYYQKNTLFENAARVPLVIAGPGVKAAGRSAPGLVEMVDLYPTLAELCGLAAPRCLSGVSLVPALVDAEARPRRSALTQHWDGYSLRTDRFRYTEWGRPIFTEWGVYGQSGIELYDHRTDPAEMVNLADDPRYKDRIGELARLLHERVTEAGAVPEGVIQVIVDDRWRKH